MKTVAATSAVIGVVVMTIASCGSFSTAPDDPAAEGGSPAEAGGEDVTATQRDGSVSPDASDGDDGSSGNHRQLSVFVLAGQWGPSTTYVPDGGGVDTGMMGMAAADAMCADEARQARLAGDYFAWLSSSTVTVAATRDAIDLLPSSAEWLMVDGSLAFPSKGYLAAGGLPKVPIDRTADGLSILTGTETVWTGTTTAGIASGVDCGGWNLPLDNATTGRASSSAAAWTEGPPQNCSASHRVYCFGR